MEVLLVHLVRIAWFAIIFPIVLVVIPCSKLKTFGEYLMGFTKRGKTMQKSNYHFNYLWLGNFFCCRNSQFLSHFYVMALIWTTLLLCFSWTYAYKMTSAFSTLTTSHLTEGSHIFSSHKPSLTLVEYRHRIWRSVFLLLLLEVQVLRRVLETFYVFKYSPSARMHILSYLVGFFFFTLAPLSLCGNAAPELLKFTADQVREFIVKGKQHHMAEFEFEWWQFLSPIIKLGWIQWTGAAIFLWGWIHQRRCHAILGSLRDDPKRMNEYKIPYGDWFELVSSPHYLAEIVIYTGLLISSGGADLTIWLLLTFVVGNLVLEAGDAHKWYLQKFEDYPTNRKAIIPYIY